MKMVLPERLSCIAVDARGNFCAGGTAHGRIYLWEACLVYPHDTSLIKTQVGRVWNHV
jgi:hypothetical protein